MGIERLQDNHRKNSIHRGMEVKGCTKDEKESAIVLADLVMTYSR